MGYRIHDRDFIARLFSHGHKNGCRLITQLLFRFERGKILLLPFKGRVEQTCTFGIVAIGITRTRLCDRMNRFVDHEHELKVYKYAKQSVC